MGKVSDKDLAQVEAARRAKVLKDIHEEEVDLRSGVIAVLCSDGDQTEKRRHLDALVGRAIGQPRVHLLAVNGGALVLSPRSPLRTAAPLLVRFFKEMALYTLWWWPVRILSPVIYALAFIFLRQDLSLLLNLWVACKMKSIFTIMLYVHAPCGAAGLAKMQFEDELYHLALAKLRVKRWLGFLGVKVICASHVNYGPNGDGETRTRTYVSPYHAVARYFDGQPRRTLPPLNHNSHRNNSSLRST